MTPEIEMWSPEQELRLLEEMAETETKVFDFDLGLPTPVVAAEPQPAWVAYWHLPPNAARKARAQARAFRGR
jgi:hypothetical protein